jgi:hypothetical protein
MAPSRPFFASHIAWCSRLLLGLPSRHFLVVGVNWYDKNALPLSLRMFARAEGDTGAAPCTFLNLNLNRTFLNLNCNPNSSHRGNARVL